MMPELPGMIRELWHLFHQLPDLFAELAEHSGELPGMMPELPGIPDELSRQMPECGCLVYESAKSLRKMVRRLRVLTGGKEELPGVLLMIGLDFSELREVVRELIGVLQQRSHSFLNNTEFSKECKVVYRKLDKSTEKAKYTIESAGTAASTCGACGHCSEQLTGTPVLYSV